MRADRAATEFFQDDQVRGGECIPTRGLFDLWCWMKIGLSIGEPLEGDPELRPVSYPADWRLDVDDNRERLFVRAIDGADRHRATFYLSGEDGRLTSELRRRLQIRVDADDTTRVVDGAIEPPEERVLFELRNRYLASHPAARTAAILAAETWLDASFPAWRHPFAYWELDVALDGVTRRVTRQVSGMPRPWTWLVFRVDLHASRRPDGTNLHKFTIQSPTVAGEQGHAYACADAWTRETLRERAGAQTGTDFLVYVQRVPTDLQVASLRPGSSFSVVFGYLPEERYLLTRQYEAVLVTDRIELAQAFVHRGGDYSGDGVALMICEYECQPGPYFLPPRDRS